MHSFYSSYRERQVKSFGDELPIWAWIMNTVLGIFCSLSSSIIILFPVIQHYLNWTHFHHNIRVRSHKYAYLSGRDQIIGKPLLQKLRTDPVSSEHVWLYSLAGDYGQLPLQEEIGHCFSFHIPFISISKRLVSFQVNSLKKQTKKAYDYAFTGNVLNYSNLIHIMSIHSTYSWV